MIALVTGGRRGIGLAITEALQGAGHRVCVVAKSPEGPGDLYVQADIRSPALRLHVIHRCLEELGGLDILVNNAGEQGHMPAVDLLDIELRAALDLMLVAPFDLSQRAYRVGAKHIINILSTSAFQGARNIAPYVAAKHGLLGLTRSLAIEWAPNVRVNAVAPGLTETDMTATYIPDDRRRVLESITPSGRFSQPGEIADAVMFLVNSTNIYGQVVTVDGGWMCKNG